MPGTGPVGVVTVTYNSGKVLDDFFDSLLAQTHRDFLLFVVDNASEDDTLRKIRERDDPRIVLIANEKNTGGTGGDNQGIRAALDAGCGSVLLLNNDTAFGPGLIESLVSGLDAHDCQMIAPKMLFHDRPNRIWCAGGRFSPWQTYAGVHRGEGRVDRGQYDTAMRVAYCPTCCMLIRRVVFESIGVMDEKYFLYWDDTDLCLRAARAGFRLVYLPEATLWHKVSSLTGGYQSLAALRYVVRNRVYFIRKNVPPVWRPYCFWFCFVRAVLGLLMGRDSLQVFRLRQEWFREGWAMPLPPRLSADRGPRSPSSPPCSRPAGRSGASAPRFPPSPPS